MALRAVGCRWRLFASAVVQSRRGEWPTWGLAVASRRRLQGRGAFSRNRATTPAFAGTPRSPHRGRTGTGRVSRGFAKSRNNPLGPVRAGARPGERQAQVAADGVFAKSRNNPPAGSGTGGARPGEGRAQVASAVVLRNRATTLPLGPARAGHDPGKDGHRSRRSWFCEIAQQPSRWDRLLPLDSLRAGAPHRGRTGAGRGDVVLRNLATTLGPNAEGRSRAAVGVGMRSSGTTLGGTDAAPHHRLPCSGPRGRMVEPGTWAIRIDPRLVYFPRGLSLKLHPMAIGLTYPPSNPPPRGRMIAVAGPHHNGVANA